jgi:hypothetical protein
LEWREYKIVVGKIKEFQADENREMGLGVALGDALIAEDNSNISLSCNIRY